MPYEADNLITPKGSETNPYDGATHSPHNSSSASGFGGGGGRNYGEVAIEVGQYTERQLVNMVGDRDRRIEMLERRVNELVVVARVPNWPRCYGIVYVDIDQEIPSRRRKYMKFLLLGYYYTIAVLIYNSIALFIATNAANDDGYEQTSSWAQGQWVSLAIAILGPFIAFPLWFYTSYRAVSTGQTIKYIISIAGVIVGLVAAVFALVGIIGMGFSGSIIMITSFSNKKNPLAGFCLLGGVIAWGLQGLIMLFALVWQIRYYRKDYSIAQLAKFAAKEALADHNRAR